jgi:futalosine hydrolase
MKILIVSATARENDLISGSVVRPGTIVKVNEPSVHDVDALITGIGAVPTTFFLTRVIQQYQLVVNIGIAGSFNPNYEVGSVVCVIEDSFGDYGIDDRGIFKSLDELKLKPKEDFPFHGDIMANPWLNDELPSTGLPFVKGVTLSTASGSSERISKVKDRWKADIETMESASVFYVCNMMGVKFICLRAISNMVEPRDRTKWELDKAINNLTQQLRNFIDIIPLINE